MSLNCPQFVAKSEPHCPYKIVLLRKKECISNRREAPDKNR